MKNKYNLSEAEAEIMELFWNTDHAWTAKELLDYFNNFKEKDWKKQTLNTFLVRLMEKNALSADESGKQKQYYPSMPKHEYVQTWTKRLLNELYDGSVKNFITALTGGEKLSKEDADELHEFIDQ